MNELALLQDQTGLLPSLTASLRRAVAEAQIEFSNKVVWLRRALRPEDFRGIEDAIEVCEELLRPATTEQRMACFGELLVVIQPPAPRDRAQAKQVAKVRWAAYHDALADLPADVLRHACTKHIARSNFFPKPKELRDASADLLGARIKMLTRLRALRDFRIKLHSDEARRSTPEELVRRRAFTQEMRRRAFSQPEPEL